MLNLGRNLDVVSLYLIWDIYFIPLCKLLSLKELLTTYNKVLK